MSGTYYSFPTMISKQTHFSILVLMILKFCQVHTRIQFKEYLLRQCAWLQYDVHSVGSASYLILYKKDIILCCNTEQEQNF